MIVGDFASKKIYAPELLTPKKKPLRNVKLKRNINADTYLLCNGSLKDLAANKALAATFTSGAGFTVGSHGRQLSSPDGEYVEFATGKNYNSGSYTISFLARINSMDANYGGLFSKNSSGTTSQISIGRNATGNNFYWGHSNSPTVVLSSSSISSLLGKYVRFHFVYDSVIAGADSFYYENGIIVDTGTQVIAPTSGTGDWILGGERNKNPSFDSDVDFVDFQVFPYAMSEQEVFRHSKDPYGLHLITSQNVYTPTAAVGGGRIMSSLANHGGLAGFGGLAGQGGGLAG
jgi:hypothetical protein